MEVVNINKKLGLINDYWNPRIVGELNNQQVRLVKIQGEFKYHKHDNEEEMFLVIKGEITIDFKTELKKLKEGEFIIIPRGQIHRPIAEKEAHLMLFVTSDNINTGDTKNEFTKSEIDRI
jgi:mannose-6-phosphate isomerase-like protein (cupin superfamily)